MAELIRSRSGNACSHFLIALALLHLRCSVAETVSSTTACAAAADAGVEDEDWGGYSADMMLLQLWQAPVVHRSGGWQLKNDLLNLSRYTARHGKNRNAQTLANTSEEMTPFAKATYWADAPDDAAPVEVDIASTSDIISIYLLMFVPLSMAWAYFWYVGFGGVMQDRFFLLLLQITYAAASLGLILANQSLCVLMRAPMALTFLQGGAMFLISGAWCVCETLVLSIRRQPGHKDDSFQVSMLLMWLPAAVVYCLFTIVDHFVSNYASLSERTVFGNLAPIVGLVLERSLAKLFVHRDSDNVAASFTSKMALFCMVFGAVLFGLQYPDFTDLGVLACAVSVVAQVVYRLVQRYFLDKCVSVPVVMLLCLDGFVVAVPTFFLSLAELDNLQTSWGQWLNNSAVLVLLLLSIASFTLSHYSVIWMLKQSTATSALVLSTIANGISVIQGIYFFGDNDFERPLAFVGILISITGGLWHSINSGQAIEGHHQKPIGHGACTDTTD